MILDFILAGLIFYLTFPLLTGYNAAQYGLSFKWWFVTGLFFPIISYFVLVIVILWDERKTRKSRLTRRERMISSQLVDELMMGANHHTTSSKEKI